MKLAGNLWKNWGGSVVVDYYWANCKYSDHQQTPQHFFYSDNKGTQLATIDGDLDELEQFLSDSDNSSSQLDE